MIAEAWMFRECAIFNEEMAPDPDRLIGQMIDLLATMNSFLEDGLGAFIAAVILKDQGRRRPIGKILAPVFEKVTIPFWTSMKPKSTNRGDSQAGEMLQAYHAQQTK